jgi:leucyl-tRNA synthetase
MAVKFVRVLEPFAPHFAEEVYERMQIAECRMQNEKGWASISRLAWPTYDAGMLVDATIEVPVQVNGKLRGRVTVARDADEATVLAAAMADGDVQKFLEGKALKKKIYVKGRMVNLVV